MLRSIPSTSRSSIKLVQTCLGSRSFLSSAGPPPLPPFLPASLLLRPPRSFRTPSLLDHQKRRVTVMPQNAILEADPNPLPTIEPLVEPPPKPTPSQIVHYHTPCITSNLCKNLLIEVSTDKGLGSMFLSVNNPFPLEIDYTLHEKGKPNAEDWETMRTFMKEERREKSLQQVPSAVLVESAENDEKISGIPKEFHSPMVVNYTARKVCWGPSMFSETEKMLSELRIAQRERLRLEARWDAHLFSQGIKPPKRDEPKQNGMLWWEKIILSAVGVFFIDRWWLKSDAFATSKERDAKRKERDTKKREEKEKSLLALSGNDRRREEARERREGELMIKEGADGEGEKSGRRRWI